MASLSRQLLDRLLDGELDQRITARRSEGASFETIARELSDEVGVSISSESLRRWAPTEAAAS